MALLYSEKTQLGMIAPGFILPSVDGKRYRLSDFSSKQVLAVFFICNHCPYVQAIEDRILTLWRGFSSKSIQFVGICSNDPTDYPDDAPDRLWKRWEEKSYGFPYLVDAEQDVAKAFGAVCTPDIFVFDAQRKLAYRGQLDNNWKYPDQVTRQDLREAIEQLLAGKTPAQEQTPSMGCSIKWRKK